MDRGQPAANSNAPAADVELVSQRTIGALSDLKAFVQISHEVDSDGTVTDAVLDPTTGKTRSESTSKDLHVAMANTGNGHDAIVVDFTKKVWYNDQIAKPEAVSSNTDPILIDLIADPAIIQAAQDAGTLQLVGTESVNGVSVVHLSLGTGQDLWVDATTYLPVRHTSTGPKLSITVDYTWTPRASFDMSKLELPVPAGFTQGAPENPLKK